MAPSQSNMYVADALAAALASGAGIIAVLNGQAVLLLPGMILLSPVAMALLRWWFEPDFDWSFFNPSVMSWGFVLGDVVLLPITLLFAGIGWDRVGNGWNQSVWFAVASGLFGLASAIVFRQFDGERYIKAGVPSALLCPTKVWHDWVVMPVTVAGLIWLLGPQVLADRSAYTAMAFVCLLMFGVVLLYDGAHAPDPTRQHPEWDPVRFKPLV